MTGRPLLALLLSAVVACGCSVRPGAELTGTGPIFFVDSMDTSNNAQVDRMVRDWNERHPREWVTKIDLPQSSDDHRAQIVARLQDAEGGARACYDVSTLDVIWTAEFADAGYVVPLDPGDFEAGDFLAEPLESARYRGKLWAVPLRSDVGLLYYRKDVLDAAGVSFPRSWAELRRQAMEIALPRKLSGYVSQFDRYEGFTVNVLEAVWDTGGDVLDPDGRIGTGSPEARQGVRRLADAFGEGWIPRETQNFNEEDTREAFQHGKALFLRNWTYAYNRLMAADSKVGRLGVAPLPTGSALGGWNVALSACSKNRRTARDFMRFLTSEQAERTYFTEAGFAPCRKAIYEDPALRRRFPHLDVIRRSIETARNRPVTPYYDQVSSAVQENLHDAVTASAPVDIAMPALTADLKAAIEGR